MERGTCEKRFNGVLLEKKGTLSGRFGDKGWSVMHALQASPVQNV